MSDRLITVRPLMSVGQVAAALRVSQRTVWRLASRAEAGEGRFPRPLRLAAQTVRWRWQDVQEYLDNLARD
jgi:predicted DNA-binding transcriptional regulator AlpA